MKFSGIILMILIFVIGCKHSPVAPPIDVNNPDPVDTTGTNGGGSVSVICDPDTVYFVQEILPIFVSNCAMTGCHDPISAQKGVVLNNYFNIKNTGDIRPFRPDNSDAYEVLVETDPDKRMPPPGSGITISTQQINKIYTWIMQGAKNNSCEPTTSGCNTQNMSFANDIFPIVQTYCTGCHSGAFPGGGVSLNSYAGVAAAANNGRLTGAINHLPGYKPMPQSQPKLDSCRIAKIDSWINAGAQNN